MAKAELVLEFKDKVTAGLRNVEGQLQSLSKTAASIKFASFITAANAATQIAKEIGRVVSDFVVSAQQAELASAQLGFAMRNLLGANEEQIRQYQEYLSILSRKTAIDDETLARLSALAFQAGVATTDFGRLATIAKQLALVTDTDLNSAFRLVLKAIQGNTESLRRWGIFLDSARVQSEGSTYVLAELEKRFGGLTEYMNTTSGALEEARVEFQDLKEEIGVAILKSQGFSDAVKSIILAVRDSKPALDVLLGGLSKIVSVVSQGVKWLITLATMVAETFAMAANIVGSTLGAIAAAVDFLIRGKFREAALVAKELLKDIRAEWQKFVYAISSTAIQATFGVQEKQLREIDRLVANIRNTTEEIRVVLPVINTQTAGIRDVVRQTTDYVDMMDNIIADIEKKDIAAYLREKVAVEIQKIRFQLGLIEEAVSRFVDGIVEAVRSGQDLLDVLKNIVEELLIAAAKAIIVETITSAIRSAIAGATGGAIPAFQAGGVVERPTLALVGEREREYIIPESKFPQPQVFVTVHNANPDTYVEVFAKMSPRAKRHIYYALRGTA